MAPETTRLVFLAIMAIGAVIWLWSLVKALALARPAATDGGWAEPRFSSPDLEARGAIETGERVVRGDCEKLSREIVRSFLQNQMGASLFEVVERTARRVVLRKTGPLVVNQPPGLYFSAVEIELEPLGGDEVRVRYRLGYGRLERRLRAIALALIFGVGLPVLLGVGALIWIFVVQSPSEAARWQVFQTIHVGHALWPPFLLLWLSRAGRRQARTFVANLITTLDYVD